MNAPHPIPYQGSKRNIAPQILRFIPAKTQLLVEPFVGSAAVSIAAAIRKKSARFHLNDVNQPLMELWAEIIERPSKISAQYSKLWRAQLENPREFYDNVREKFNKTGRPDYLLYLLARCIKASVRYNDKGEFNQSPDNRRLGRNPSMMRNDITATSKLFRDLTTLTHLDYKEALSVATVEDLVYMDPPYQGTFESGGFRYFKDLNHDDFLESLYELSAKQIPFILSYDGRTGSKSFGKTLPDKLKLTRIEINAGRSSQATLLGRNHITYESLYLSKALVKKLDVDPQQDYASQAFEQAEMFTTRSE